MTQTLRGLARDGRTVIASIHQPSSEVFELFDMLFLLSSGKTVYFGQASQACEVSHLTSHQIQKATSIYIYLSPLSFAMFSNVTILCSCLQFFAQTGFPCPPLRNPSDHFLRCVNSDFDKVKATLKGSMKARVRRDQDTPMFIADLLKLVRVTMHLK